MSVPKVMWKPGDPRGRAKGPFARPRQPHRDKPERTPRQPTPARRGGAALPVTGKPRNCRSSTVMWNPGDPRGRAKGPFVRHLTARNPNPRRTDDDRNCRSPKVMPETGGPRSNEWTARTVLPNPRHRRDEPERTPRRPTPTGRGRHRLADDEQAPKLSVLHGNVESGGPPGSNEWTVRTPSRRPAPRPRAATAGIVGPPR